MKNQQRINYFLILVGSILVIYAQTGDEKPLAFLITGIVILMFGVYRISSKIPSKFDKDVEEVKHENHDV
ncbi:hypothetical protein BZARG_2354 [Bizionia argentinensis JUB59]|uniref:Uncharacterized protein n=1 Tax=Bizionia argentinensis JUB59 TaxID=1046627 RepID=G2ECB2_9FLAO|nr:hypothetical protein [Bizionia argentinensis]EGV43921.1 hypothetical protein BZARG_2354 [Bizionia argentinensis JUB59]